MTTSNISACRRCKTSKPCECDNQLHVHLGYAHDGQVLLNMACREEQGDGQLALAMLRIPLGDLIEAAARLQRQNPGGPSDDTEPARLLEAKGYCFCKAHSHTGPGDQTAL